MRKSVPTRIAVLGVLLGLLVGGVFVGVSYGQLVGGGGATATSTTTITESETATVSGGPSAATTTVTEAATGSSIVPSMSIEPTELLYSGGDLVTLIGSIYPPPSSSEGILVTVNNPVGSEVQVGTAFTGVSNSTFAFLVNAGVTPEWVSGTYTAIATTTTGSQSATTFFYYSASQFGGGLSDFQVVAPTTASPGHQVDVAVLSTALNGAPDEVTSWSTFTLFFPDGRVQELCASPAASSPCTGTFTRIQEGFYQVSFTLPATAPGGTYYVEAAGSDASGNAGHGIAQFSVP